LRIGSGYDIHPLKAGRDLIIGGVRIEHPTGLDGHSDADVLTHAVIDALLGAASLGNIGEHFPADDSTVIAEEPRLQPHLRAMRSNLAQRLGVVQDVVSVKATSPEGLGALGHRSGIAAQAVALIDGGGLT